MATPSLLGLPAELLVKIIDDIEPGTHFNFALASRRLYQVSEDVLKRHRHWHGENKLRSDLHPLTTTRLVENILLDRIAVWHIQDLEFWCLRRESQQWVDETRNAQNLHSLPEEEKQGSDQFELSQASCIFQQWARVRWRDHLVEQFGYDDGTAAKLLDEVGHGREEPLKLLILALAPRLRSIKTPSLYLDSSDTRGGANAGIFALLSSLVAKRHSHNRIWPPGFTSLRSLSIGVGHSRDPGFVYPFSMIAPLLTLPNLEYFYLDHPYSSQNIGEERYHLPRRISTVKHLHLTSSDLEINEMSEMLTGIAKLESFSLQSLHRNGCDVVRLLSMHQSDSLQYLDMCDTDVLQRLYERYFSKLSIDGLRMFSSLRYIAIDLLVLLHQHIETRYAHPGQLIILKPHTDVSRIDLASILPQTIEYINFRISNSNYVLSNQVADAVSSMVANTVRSKKSSALKAIFFDDISNFRAGLYNPIVTPHTGGPLWREAEATGREYGVEVFTFQSNSGFAAKTRMDELGIPRVMFGRDMMTARRKKR